MKRLCFLSCQSLEAHVTDENLAIEELEKKGEYTVTTIPWDGHADWRSFDLVITRTTWDYHKRPTEFLEKLKVIASQTKLLNSAPTVEWNIHKGYLKELESKGVRIVPTHIFTFPGDITPPTTWTYQQFILKPAISASAYKTIIVQRAELNTDTIKSQLHAGDWILQPFMEEIKRGEISLIYFNKKFSHSILKVPKAGDFRVQEEHGGHITNFSPSAALLAESQALLDMVPYDLLFARVDMVHWHDEYVLMEIELIEPALYFRTHPQSPQNFKDALDKIFTTP